MIFSLMFMSFLPVSISFPLSHKGGESSDRGSGARRQAAGWPVEGAVLAGRVTGALLAGGGSPAALGPEQAALALALAGGLALGQLGLGAGRAELRRQRGEGRQRRRDAVLGLARLGLGVAVGLRPRDALLLAAPGVVVGGVADVVVDEGVRLLPALVHLVLAVAALQERRRRGEQEQEEEEGRESEEAGK